MRFLSPFRFLMLPCLVIVASMSVGTFAQIHEPDRKTGQDCQFARRQDGGTGEGVAGVGRDPTVSFSGACTTSL